MQAIYKHLEYSLELESNILYLTTIIEILIQEKLYYKQFQMCYKLLIIMLNLNEHFKNFNTF